MFVMAVLVTVIVVMPVLFKVNSVSPFNVVGTACVNLNNYPWRRWQIAIYVDTHVGKPGSPGGVGKPGGTGKPGGAGSPALASLIPKVMTSAAIIRLKRIDFLCIKAPFSTGSYSLSGKGCF